jgi:hypothetical protein
MLSRVHSCRFESKCRKAERKILELILRALFEELFLSPSHYVLVADLYYFIKVSTLAARDSGSLLKERSKHAHQRIF